MSALSIFKSATEVVVSIGVGAIVGNLVKATTPVPTTVKGLKAMRIVNRGSVVVGSWALSGAVGNIASKYAVSQIDDAVEKFNEVKSIVGDAVEKLDDEA